MGFFHKPFDFNRDGKLSTFEKAARAATFCAMMDEEKKSSQEKNVSVWDDDEDESELESAGLDRDELEWMDEDERREALEDAGLDPDDYDF